MTDHITLPLPTSGEIHHIFHFADVHIRDGDSTRSRFHEYLQVINNTINTLKRHPSVSDGTAISVIVGDTLDHKSKLGGAGCTLFNHFIKGVAECGPVYIVQGNHDFQQAFPDEPSMLDALLINAPENVFYMNKTGHYVAGSVGFGLVLTRDTLLLGSGAGQLEELPAFPDPKMFTDRIQTKVALFHGTIKGCLLQNYHPSQEGYPKDWISGYDLHLLGDIHLEQVNGADIQPELSAQNRRKILSWKDCTDVWAYPGSLVQQSFGENPFSNHGFLHWDLDQKLVHTYHIKNPCAKMYIKCIEGQWLASFPEKRWEPLTTAIDVGGFNHIELRIRNRIHNNDIENLHKMLAEYEPMTYEITNGLLNNHIYDEIEVSNSDADGNADGNGDGDENEDRIGTGVLTCEQYNSPQTWIHYIQEHHTPQILEPVADKWQGWLLNPKSLLIKESEVDPSNGKIVADRNKKIQKYINELQLQLSQMVSTRTKLRIRYLEWSWLLCYGEKNWVNFDELSRQISGAKAANHKGKSAFFDIICLALFGKPTPLRKNTDGVIHDSKPHGTRPRVSIIVDVNGDTYRISREFSKLDTGTTQNVKPMVCRIFKNGYKAVAQGSTVSKWIAQHIGDRKDFLLSSMITQVQDQNFIFVGHREQLDILDKSLNLNAYNTLLGLLQEVRNAYSSIASKHQTICSKVRNTMVAVDTESANLTKKRYQKRMDECSLLEQELARIQVNTEIIQQSQGVSIELIQKYIQAHQTIIGTETAKELQQQFNKNPDGIYREWKDQLLTLQTKWGTLKNDHDPKFKEDMIAAARQKYRELTGMCDSGRAVGVDGMDGMDGMEDVVIQPSINQEALNHEAKIITEWKAKWKLFLANPTCDMALTTTVQQIQLVSEKIKANEVALVKLQTKVQEEVTNGDNEDFETWKKRNDALLKIDENQYVELVALCKNNPLVHPSVEKGAIEQLENGLETELSVIKTKEWRNNVDDRDQELLSEIQSEKERLSGLVQQLRTQIDEMSKVVRPIEPVTIKEPAPTVNECKARIACFHKRVASLEDDKKRLNLLETYCDLQWNVLPCIQKEKDNLVDRIAEIRATDYPFNPECSACQEQPWRIELNATETKLEVVAENVLSVETKIEELVRCIGNEEGWDQSDESAMKYCIQTIRERIVMTEHEIENGYLHDHQATLQEWDRYQKYELQKQQYNDAVEHWISAKDKIIQLQTDITSVDLDLQRVNEQHNDIQYCIAHRAKWNETRKTCIRFREEWDAFAQNQEHHQRLQRIDQARAELDVWKAKNRINELEHDLIQLNTSLDGLRANEKNYTQFLDEKVLMTQREEQWETGNSIWVAWGEYNRLLKAREAFSFQQRMELVENKTQYLHWMLVLRNKEMQNQVDDLTGKIKECRADCNELLKTITTYANSQELYNKQNQECALLQSQIDQLTSTHVAINHLVDIFTDFRLWLYKTKIIPRLLCDANLIADVIVGKDEHKCALQCNITTSNGSRKEIMLDWRVHSSAGSPSIHYSGGFQKIIYGLALRIAIANIGASSIVCEQLFIDEGFSSADTEHLERVELLLNNLLNLYDSIIMVTHIETLQEAITTNMTILRDEQHLTSTLQQGQKPADSMGASLAHTMSTDKSNNGEICGRNEDTDQTKAIANLTSLVHKICPTEIHSPSSNQITVIEPTTQFDPDKCQGVVTSTGLQCRYKKKIGDYCKKHATKA